MRREVLLAATLAMFACIPVDRRSPFARPSYRDDFDAIQRAALDAAHGRGPYRAGWARVAIEAPAGVPLAGFGEREGAPSIGVRDPSYVRAFAVEAGGRRIVLVTADLLLLDFGAARAIRERLADRAIDPDSVFFTASHTHSGPGGYASGMLWELVAGAFDARAFEAVVEAHLTAVEKALSDLAPARIGAASERVPDLIKNRTEKDGPVDDRLFVLRFEKSDGRAAAFWAYGCHAVTLVAGNLRLSADYPGEVASAYEGRDRGLEVLGFAAGGVGSSNPRVDRDETSWLVEPLIAGLERGLARAKEKSLSEGSLAGAQVDRPLPPLGYRISDEIGVWGGAVAPLLGGDRIRYGAIALGNTVLLHLPSEASGELTRAARARAARSGVELGIFPFNGTYLGYVTPRRVYDLPEEKGEELLFYETHTMTFLGPWGGDLMMNLGLRLASGVRSWAAQGRSWGSARAAQGRSRTVDRDAPGFF